jgi:uncharacterized protein YcgL (UPF0745 family)
MTSENPQSEKTVSGKVLVDVYKSSVRAEMYLYVNRDEALKRVPEVLLSRFGKPVKVMTIPLHEQRPLARADVATVLAALKSQGFYLQMPPAEDEPPLKPGRD